MKTSQSPSRPPPAKSKKAPTDSSVVARQRATPETIQGPMNPNITPKPAEVKIDMSLCATPVPGLIFTDSKNADGALIVETVLDDERVIAVDDEGTRLTLEWADVDASETPSEHGLLKKIAPAVLAAMPATATPGTANNAGITLDDVLTDDDLMERLEQRILKPFRPETTDFDVDIGLRQIHAALSNCSAFYDAEGGAQVRVQGKYVGFTDKVLARKLYEALEAARIHALAVFTGAMTALADQ